MPFKGKKIHPLPNARSSVLEQMVVHSLTSPHLLSKLLSAVPKGSLLEFSIPLAKWNITPSLYARRTGLWHIWRVQLCQCLSDKYLKLTFTRTKMCCLIGDL